jgi:hypothetical protein
VLPPTYIPRPYDPPRGHLLRPLQANLGYYEGSVALRVDRVSGRTGLGDPAFMMEQRFGVRRCLVRPRGLRMEDTSEQLGYALTITLLIMCAKASTTDFGLRRNGVSTTLRRHPRSGRRD